jgi:hypothetical protein
MNILGNLISSCIRVQAYVHSMQLKWTTIGWLLYVKLLHYIYIYELCGRMSPAVRQYSEATMLSRILTVG